MKVLVEYSFIINPENGWSSISDFEQMFGDFLATRGLTSRRITTQDGREMFEVEALPEQAVAEVEPEKTIKQIKADLTKKRDPVSGKFTKPNVKPTGKTRR